MRTKKSGFVLDRDIIQDASITIEARGLYALIASYDKGCSIDEIRDNTGMSNGRLDIYLRKLTQIGLIKEVRKEMCMVEIKVDTKYTRS